MAKNKEAAKKAEQDQLELGEETDVAVEELDSSRECANEDSQKEISADGSEDSIEEDDSAENSDDEDILELEQEIADLKDELKQAQDAKLRLAAEYDNFRKRSRQEKDALYKQSIVDVTVQWLPVVDNLERALDSCSELKTDEAKAVATGVKLTLKQAAEVMEKLGVEEIEALGETFNPEYHEAVMHEEDSEQDSEKIVEVFQKGYKCRDKVLRHSVVKVVN